MTPSLSLILFPAPTSLSSILQHCVDHWLHCVHKDIPFFLLLAFEVVSRGFFTLLPPKYCNSRPNLKCDFFSKVPDYVWNEPHSSRRNLTAIFDMLLSCLCIFLFFFSLLRIEPRTSHMLGKCSTTELHSSPSYSLYDPCVAMATLLVNGSSS